MDPADAASRGCTVKHLLQSSWWNGPNWLYTNRDHWPRVEIICSQQEILLCPVNISTEDFNYFSKYSKIIRVIVWTAVKILEELTFEEIERAEIHLLKSIWVETFGSNPNHLRNLQITVDR
ncbi:hypothetical protein JTB14_000071 [Gonioctena quinquepunctata]|nr:hypothetical protein JTB14_000071 [Gonioctena quinquepunctata]